MKEIIGLWLMYLVIVFLALGMSFELDLKEKLQLGASLMAAITILVLAAYLLLA